MNPSFDDSVALDRLQHLANAVKDQLANVVVGQSEAIELIMIGLLANGHCLLIGVPGLAKTLIVRTFASVLDVQFARIQFTPI